LILNSDLHVSFLQESVKLNELQNFHFVHVANIVGYQTGIAWSTILVHDVIVTDKKNTAEPAVGMGVGFSDNLPQIFSLMFENVIECTVKFHQHILFCLI